MTDRPAKAAKGANQEEIEITPEMIEAGSEALQSLLPLGTFSFEFVASEVYSAMARRGASAPSERQQVCASSEEPERKVER